MTVRAEVLPFEIKKVATVAVDNPKAGCGVKTGMRIECVGVTSFMPSFVSPRIVVRSHRASLV